MPELPKSVIARLKAQPAPQDHPDADLLAAFAEQALTGRERESVLAHLAACEACRETVTLAAPQPPALQPVAIIVPWYRRPQTFAWAGALATVALVGALILNYASSGDRNFVVSDATPAKVVRQQPPENKPEAAPAPQASATGKVESAKRLESLRDDARAKGGREQRKNKPEEERAAPALAGVPHQAAPKDEKKLDGGVLQDQYVMKEAAPSAPPPAAPAARTANVVNEKQQAAAEADALSVESAATARPKSADAALAGAAGGSISPSKIAKLAAAPARWSVSEKGRLQRSLDSGRTWQPQLAKEETVFRAVAMVGSDVWAGGSGAALFHSSDGGTTWIRQVLPGASADVVSLQFQDSQHGSARTSDGITWLTSDGGLHWARQ